MTHSNISPDPDTAAIDSRIDEAVYELEHQPDVELDSERREPGIWKWVLLAAMAVVLALAIVLG